MPATPKSANGPGQPDYEIVIKPTTGWFNLDLGGLLEYRDLLYLLVRRDFVANYKQTVLGPAWFVIQPLLTSVVFTVIFSNLAGLSTEGKPNFLFYLGGLLLWTYFAGILGGASNTLAGNANLYGKVYFPRLVVPLATVVSKLLALAIQLLTFLGFYAFYAFALGKDIAPSPMLAFFPVLIVQTCLLALGTSLWLSSLTAKYRDFQFLLGFITQLWMYASFIIVPFSVVPEKWRELAALNPMTMIVAGTREAFLGGDSLFQWDLYLIGLAVTLVIAVTGITVFQRTQRRFIDTV